MALTVLYGPSTLSHTGASGGVGAAEGAARVFRAASPLRGFNPKPQILNPEPHTLHPKRQALNPEIQTLNPRLLTLHPTP